MLRLHIILTAVLFYCLSAAAGSAQTYPSKPIHMIVPTSAGGITDTLARALAQRLTESLGQQVFVEDKPGGAGSVWNTSPRRSRTATR